MPGFPFMSLFPYKLKKGGNRSTITNKIYTLFLLPCTKQDYITHLDPFVYIPKHNYK